MVVSIAIRFFFFLSDVRVRVTLVTWSRRDQLSSLLPCWHLLIYQRRSESAGPSRDLLIFFFCLCWCETIKSLRWEQLLLPCLTHCLILPSYVHNTQANVSELLVDDMCVSQKQQASSRVDWKTSVYMEFWCLGWRNNEGPLFSKRFTLVFKVT